MPTARELDRSLVQGIAWTAGLKWVAQIFSWAATLIVARLLTREDYGLVAMATVVLGLISLVNEFGLGAAVIKRRDLSEHQIAQISGLCVVSGPRPRWLARPQPCRSRGSTNRRRSWLWSWC